MRTNKTINDHLKEYTASFENDLVELIEKYQYVINKEHNLNVYIDINTLKQEIGNSVELSYNVKIKI